jgi:hypothetical protein
MNFLTFTISHSILKAKKLGGAQEREEGQRIPSLAGPKFKLFFFLFDLFFLRVYARRGRKILRFIKLDPSRLKSFIYFDINNFFFRKIFSINLFFGVWSIKNISNGRRPPMGTMADNL